MKKSKVIKTYSPEKKESAKFLERFGDNLVAVRDRKDLQGVNFQTVEIRVEKVKKD